MRNDYIVVLNGHNVFREIELSADASIVRAGTTKRCDFRFRKEQFFAPFELEFSRQDNSQWVVKCSEEVYFSSDDVQKLAFKKLKHGDTLDIRYFHSNVSLFQMSFSIDFNRENSSFNRYVDLSQTNNLSIGGLPNANLILNGQYTEGDLVCLYREGTSFVLKEEKTRYGVRFNGLKLKAPRRLQDKSFFSIANFYFYYTNEKLYFAKTADIVFSGINCYDVRSECKGSEYPRFNRNTRILSKVDTDDITILDPPSKPQKPKGNIILQLLPAVAMLVITVVLRSTLMQSGGSFVILSAAMIGIGILTSVLGIINDRRGFKKEVRERKEKYSNYLENKKTEIEEERAKELRILNNIYPSLEKEAQMVDQFSGDLFERYSSDEDFLDVRLGIGARESSRKIKYKDKESLEVDELAALPLKVSEKYQCISNAPIVVPAHLAGAIGVVGAYSKTRAILKTMVIDICLRQYQNDVKVFFVVENQNLPAIYWARNMPHVQNEELNCRNIVCDDESKNIIFEYLYKLISFRETKEVSKLPHLVIFVIDECGLKNHPLSQFIDHAADLGVTFVFFEYFKEHLPQGCNWLIALDRTENEGVLVDRSGKTDEVNFVYEAIDENDALAISQRLAPVYCEEVTLEGSLTKSLTMFEMLDIIAADDLDLSKRWAESAIHKSMAAPIGVTKSKTINLDLSDKAHGPHGLVAGTTGSGKSEILQTYILSMATLYHPYEVGFVIIDFKGGGMVNQFRNLPHLVGAITNIDGREIDRSLKSIKAELQKRQKYFAAADVNHINNYILKYKAGEVSEPLPHLIIIVDEFAELKAEQPEFMKELISASRIGRSLGVHLILATQKPAGQVSEQIWSNSRFKLCLKVQSKEDSNEVIKSPLASEIKEPGRAYFQVGNNEIFELLQSGFSGAPERADNDDTKEFVIYQVEPSGKRIPVYARTKNRKEDELQETQLDAIVEHVSSYCLMEHIQPLASICLPPLPSVVEFPDQFFELYKNGELGYPLGIYDDPDNQYQGPAYFDLANTNMFIVGSGQQGKTNFLQTIIKGIASTSTPLQSAIYILDFGSMILKNFEELNHVGGVVIPSEDEKLKNLFSLLSKEIVIRRKKQLAVGVSSFASYLEAGHTDLPHIFLILDNFAVFKELYAERYEDQLLTLCREGITYGISVIIANSATSGFGYKYISNFSTHVAFVCNDSSEYMAVFDRCRMEPKQTAGRALFSKDKNIYEFQSYLSFNGEKEIERVENMKKFVAAQSSIHGDVRARRIPSVPNDLTLDYLEKNYECENNEMVFAMSYSKVAPLKIDLNSQFSLGLVGNNHSSKVLFINTLLAEIEQKIFDRSVEVRILDDLNRELSSYSNKPYVCEYSSDFGDIEPMMSFICEQAMFRHDLVKVQGFEALEDLPYLITIVNSLEAIEHFSEISDQVEMFKKTSKQCAAMRILVVFSGFGDATVGYSSAAMLKDLKENRRAFVFSTLDEHKFFDVTAAQVRTFKGPLEETQGFYVSGNEIDKVKIAIAQ